MPEADPVSVSDRAFWLAPYPFRDRWIDALEDIDRRGDKTALLALLRADSTMPREARCFLADLIDRYTLKKKRGRQRVPLYDKSHTEALLEMANEDVDDLMATKVISLRDAADIVRKSYGLWEVVNGNDPLLNFRRGSRGSTRRMKKRISTALKS